MNALKKAYRVFSTAEKYFLFVIFFFATANCKCKLDTRTVKIS